MSVNDKVTLSVELDYLREFVGRDVLNEAYNTMAYEDFLVFSEKEEHWWDTANLQDLRAHVAYYRLDGEL